MLPILYKILSELTDTQMRTALTTLNMTTLCWFSYVQQYHSRIMPVSISNDFSQGGIVYVILYVYTCIAFVIYLLGMCDRGVSKHNASEERYNCGKLINKTKLFFLSCALCMLGSRLSFWRRRGGHSWDTKCSTRNLTVR